MYLARLTDLLCCVCVCMCGLCFQMRYTDQQKLQQHQKNEIHLFPDQVTKMKARLRLIDTTLLKCYLKVWRMSFQLMPCLFLLLKSGGLTSLML